MKGFYNQILKINLSDQSYLTDPVADELLERYLGGKDLATHLLNDHEDSVICQCVGLIPLLSQFQRH